MSIEQLVISILIPLVGGLIMFTFRHLYNKINHLDERLRKGLSQTEVRQLVEDKVTPIRDDIKEIKIQVDRLVDLYLHDHYNK